MENLEIIGIEIITMQIMRSLNRLICRSVLRQIEHLSLIARWREQLTIRSPSFIFEEKMLDIPLTIAIINVVSSF